VIQGDEDLLNHATDFYKTLFGPVEDKGVRLSGDVWNSAEKLNDTDRKDLNKRFTEEEVKSVVDQMKKKQRSRP
jgi:hypothetical protein